MVLKRPNILRILRTSKLIGLPTIRRFAIIEFWVRKKSAFIYFNNQNMY